MKGEGVVKRKNHFSTLSVVFTALTSVCFMFMALDCIYIINLEKELVSVLIAFGFAFAAVVLAFLVIVFGVLGVVFAVLAFKRQGNKTLNIITLTMAAVLVAVTIGLFVFVYCWSLSGS